MCKTLKGTKYKTLYILQSNTFYYNKVEDMATLKCHARHLWAAQGRHG